MSIDAGWIDTSFISLLILIVWRLAELQLFFFKQFRWCHPMHSDILQLILRSQLCRLDTLQWHCEFHMECVEIWNGHRKNWRWGIWNFLHPPLFAKRHEALITLFRFWGSKQTRWLPLGFSWRPGGQLRGQGANAIYPTSYPVRIWHEAVLKRGPRTNRDPSVAGGKILDLVRIPLIERIRHQSINLVPQAGTKDRQPARRPGVDRCLSAVTTIIKQRKITYPISSNMFECEQEASLQLWVIMK